MPNVPPSCVGPLFPKLPAGGGATTGPVRTSVTRKHIQPPRPPNAWILYRSEKIRTLPPLQPGEARRAQADVSRMISEMWKNETEEERGRYERMAEQKKAEHQLKYPGYRFQPQKKEEKQRLRETMKRERQNTREARKNRGGANSDAPLQLTALLYTPETQHGLAGPSPPLSATPLPRTENASSPESDDLSITTPNASQPPISAQLPLISTNTPFALPFDISWATQRSATYSVPISPTTLSCQWDHQTTTDLPILPTPQDPTTSSFPVATSQGWLCNGHSQELEALQTFFSAAADPSIFHLNDIDINLLTANPTGEIEVCMGQVPLAFDDILSPENGISIPDYTSFDFCNMAGPSLQSFDMISPPNTIPPVPSPGLLLSSGSSDSMTYNAEEYLNFDETDGEVRSAPYASSCEPPSGAAYSSWARWKRQKGERGTQRVPAN